MFQKKPLVRSVAAILASSLALSVYAAESSDGAQEEAVERIEVTGSRIKRTDLEGPQPVTVITSEDMAERGYTTVFDALSDLPQNTGIQIEGAEAQLFTPDVQTVNLRNFGVGYTLMLVNGKRVANYPAAYQSDTSVFNYGAIPAAAVERVEILSTGASAIYGSDAVAGVVNIILKKDFDATNVNLLVTQNEEAGKGDKRFQFTSGKSWEGGNVTLALEYMDRDALLGSDFSDYDSNLDYPYGVGVLDRAVLNLNQWDLYGFGTRPSDGGYVDPGVGTCEGMNNGTVRAFRPDRGWFCGASLSTNLPFRNAKESISGFVNFNQEIGSDLEVFADVLYYSSESEGTNQYLGVFEEIYDINGPTRDDLVFGPGIFNDWFLAQRLFTADDLGRDIDPKFSDDALALNIGLRGSWGDHEWDLTVNQSTYEFTSEQAWFKAEKVLEYFLGDFLGFSFFGSPWFAGNGTFGFANPDNLFGALPANVAADLIGDQKYRNETLSRSVQFTLTGDLMDLPAGPMSYALVAEYQYEDFELIPDDRLLQDPPADGLRGSGWWGLTGYTGEGDRTRSALGVEVTIPVLESLNVNIAARVDSYDNTSSSIGTRVTPQLSFDWRPFEELLVRGGYAGSFRAPDMNQVYTSTGFYTGGTDYVQCREAYFFEQGTYDGFNLDDCDAGTIFARRTAGTNLSDTEEALKDETGYSTYLGFVFEPIDKLSLGLTYNYLELEDLVVTESIQGLLDDEYRCYIGDSSVPQSRCDYISRRIERGVDGTTGLPFIREFNATPINAAMQSTKSIDADVAYGWDTDFGSFQFGLQYTHILENKYRCATCTEDFDVRDDLGFSGYNFRSIVSGQLTYSYGDFSTTLSGVRRGSTPKYNQENVGEGESTRLGPYITYNLTGVYSFTEDMYTRVMVSNLFDTAPPKDDTMYFYDYPWYNVYIYGGGGLGREISLEVGYNF